MNHKIIKTKSPATTSAVITQCELRCGNMLSVTNDVLGLFF